MSAERTLAAAVHLDGMVYPAGTSVPAEVAERITNPKAWGDEPTRAESSVKTAGKAPKSKGSGKKAEPKAAPAAPAGAPDASDTASGETDLVAPPRVGAGSGTDAWRSYALAAVAKAGLNIDIPEGTKRDDIVAALEEAGISTKPKE
ncbi:hypothetical protein [Subtercola sp. YIM 133946]|uniref:hypothetical protein n=1 Tax=Subtercola sp. YIM 133946 TaxID=3118909 RepID=UPI002F950162